MFVVLFILTGFAQSVTYVTFDDEYEYSTRLQIFHDYYLCVGQWYYCYYPAYYCYHGYNSCHSAYYDYDYWYVYRHDWYGYHHDFYCYDNYYNHDGYHHGYNTHYYVHDNDGAYGNSATYHSVGSDNVYYGHRSSVVTNAGNRRSSISSSQIYSRPANSGYNCGNSTIRTNINSREPTSISRTPSYVRPSGIVNNYTV